MPDIQFKAMWRFPKRKTTVMDYQCKDLGTLLKLLHRSEGVDVTTVDELVIHQIDADGSVKELFASNAPATVCILPPPEASTTGRDLIRATTSGPTSKPRVRIKARPYVEDVSKVVAAMGLYTAYVAPPKREANG